MPTGQKKSPALAKVLQHLVLLQLFLPLVALSVTAIGVGGYFGVQTIKSKQQQKAQVTARMVDHYLDQAARTLDVVARIAEVKTPRDLAKFMQGTWESYGTFDTLYHLNVERKITLLWPHDLRYQGLDMSNLAFSQQRTEKKETTISRPFISVRTGNPTVYLASPLTRGGQIVGELNLGSLQDEIVRGQDGDQHAVFIMDQSGRLLAHPAANLVRQQTNQSDLEIFRRGLGGEATAVYGYGATWVLGSAARVKRAGWVVVDQAPVAVSLGPYAWVLGLTLLAALAIWLGLSWSLRNQLAKQVAVPLTQLSQGTNALAQGDFDQGKTLASLPAAFAELTALATDFQQMSGALQTRQEALKASEERYRTMFDRVPIPLFRVTATEKIIDVNPAAAYMLGYQDTETLLQANVENLYVNPEDGRRWFAIADREGIVRDFEVQLRRCDGMVIWGRLTSRAVRDSQGRTLYYEGSIEDVTDSKRVKEEIQRLNEELEKRVHERTAQLETANRELESFAYSVSHDLRAPLRHIDGFLELLQKKIDAGLNPQSRHYLEAVLKATQRMDSLINDLLAFSRIGRYEMKKRAVDLGDLVREVIQEFAPETAGRRISWQVTALPAVFGDRSLLRAALVNLISNALKFTRPRGETEIGIGCRLEEGGQIVCFIRDNGVGFDMTYVDKLFGVFQRLHRAEEFEGTGIGLANVRRIIARHGGRTWAEGAVDRGATFFFSLPQPLEGDRA